MKIGYIIKTPRFLTVRINEVLTSEEAYKKGYTEPTHFEDPDYDILGKAIGANRMEFSAVIKGKK